MTTFLITMAVAAWVVVLIILLRATVDSIFEATNNWIEAFPKIFWCYVTAAWFAFPFIYYLPGRAL
ncbi:TPA: hypothetical protein ACNICD_000574 [Acinetobacter baumannii]|nr:hypothetical protein B7L44_06910 [Acinetobacter nosocomialis]RSN88690.1 hypothetical protein EA768_00815 [Acinetobacter nosocomialis]